jgi:hypothetical protein
VKGSRVITSGSRPRAAQHVVGDLDAMHHAVVANTVQEESQPDSAAEADVRDGCAARNLRGLNGRSDHPLISPVQRSCNERTQDSVWAAELPGHRGQQPLAQ